MTRTRIGVVVPSTNTTCEADFQSVAPRDVTIHGQRMWLTNDATDESGMERMNAEIENSARYLATAGVNLIVYGCTTGSFYKGPGWDKEMIALFEREAGVPAIGTSPAVVQALQHFNAKKISVASPYPEWANVRLRSYFENMGFDVLNVDGDPVASGAGNQGYNDQHPDRVVEFAPASVHRRQMCFFAPAPLGVRWRPPKHLRNERVDPWSPPIRPRCGLRSIGLAFNPQSVVSAVYCRA